tara:strand:- start:286 stop:657 length:372 start_codon:yes stop_codon:yes gene_type:complete
MMKKIAITLLTLLILGGCSQEPTELERCIEANTPSLEYNLGEKFQKFREENKSLREEDFDKYYDKLRDFEINIKTDFEHEVLGCSLDESGTFSSEEARKICIEIISSELIEKAKKICHSQGIY